MEKHPVLQDFTDAETGHIYRAGADTYDVPSAERVAELMSDSHPNHKGAIIGPALESKAGTDELSEKTSGELSKDSTNAQIVAYLKAHEIDLEGKTKKADLIALIK